MRTAIFLLAIVGILTGCATPYQEKAFAGGFSETRLDENVWLVIFNGNGYTRSERTSDFNLLRCADLCLENGYNYFTIVDGKDYTNTSSYTTPTTLHTTDSAYSYGGYIHGSSTTQAYGGQTYNFVKPSTSNTIVCFRQKPEFYAYSAAFIADSIRKKYGLSAQ